MADLTGANSNAVKQRAVASMLTLMVGVGFPSTSEAAGLPKAKVPPASQRAEQSYSVQLHLDAPSDVLGILSTTPAAYWQSRLLKRLNLPVSIPHYAISGTSLSLTLEFKSKPPNLDGVMAKLEREFCLFGDELYVEHHPEELAPRPEPQVASAQTPIHEAPSMTLVSTTKPLAKGDAEKAASFQLEPTAKTSSIDWPRWRAAGASLVIPGAGEAYEGDWMRGGLFALAALTSLAAWSMGHQSSNSLLTTTGMACFFTVGLVSPVDAFFLSPTAGKEPEK